MREFRHEYQNVILSLNEYLETNDFSGLRSYYNQSLKKMGVRLTKEKYALEDASRITNKELKSIIFNKLNCAQSKGVMVSFECRDVIQIDRAMVFPIVLIIGIILDNALDATIDQENGYLQMALVQNKENQIIMVKNSIIGTLPPLWKLKTKGFSTKGENRGLGLANLQTIINQQPEMILETTIGSNYFLQKIILTKGDCGD